MPISIGQHVGSYEVTALLGKGGMGEVYRARDARLKRDVAIKVLPEEFCRDAERVSRFQREAQALAALNHPNIAGIHDLQDADDARFLVLELVEGETLAERIARGPLPADEAIGVARQIAEAVGAAHEKGIIHRDLKPANIKLTPDGRVKVLDFGLAKMFEPDVNESSPQSSPTMKTLPTAGGVILGTAAYMSPEQARGKFIDRRTDVWAFGCVLFEMLAGHTPFSGETVTDTLARILEREPDLKLLPETVPPHLRSIIQRCLRKDVRRRFQDIGDVRNEFDEIVSEPAVRNVPKSAARWRERLAWTVAILALGSLFVAGSYQRWFVPDIAAPAAVRFNIIPPDGVIVPEFATAAISPDGQQIVSSMLEESGKLLLYLRRLGSFSAQALPGTEGGYHPFWSPDGRFIAFFSIDERKLKKIEITGGPAQDITSAPPGSSGGTWNTNGDIVFADGSGRLFRASANRYGESTPVATDVPGWWPYFLPDGKHFLFVTVGGGAEFAAVHAGSLDSKDTKRLESTTAAAVFAEPGYLLFMRNGALTARGFDPGSLEFTGEPLQVADDVLSFAGERAFSASSNGTLLFRMGRVTKQMTWFDRAGKLLGTAGPPGDIASPVLSPDENRVAFSRDGDIWLLDLLRGTVSRFTSDPSLDYYPIWSPDGSRIVFDSDREGRGNLYMKSSGGTGAEELLLKSSNGKYPFGWSPQGQWLVYHENDPQAGSDLYMLPMAGDRKPVRYLQTNFNEFENAISADGRWMAYVSDEGGGYDIYVQTVPPSERKWQISSAGGFQPHWRRDGKELYYLALDGTLMAVDVRTGSAFNAGLPRALFKMRAMVNGARNSYSPTADGQRFLVNSFLASTSEAPIAVVLSWRADLKK